MSPKTHSKVVLEQLATEWDDGMGTSGVGQFQVSDEVQGVIREWEVEVEKWSSGRKGTRNRNPMKVGGR